MPTAVVTGAGIRIGKAIALALADAGYDLALHVHRSTEGVEEVAHKARALGRTVTVYRADLGTPQGVESLAAAVREAHPAVDVLVNNAGIYERVAFEDITRERYHRMMGINLEAPFFLTQALLPALRAAPNPLVVNLTDIAAERAESHYAHYSASKAGLLMLTRALAVELAPKVRVNAISPGAVIFPEDFDEASQKAILARIPLGRVGTAEDVARVVVFLAREAPYISGQVIAVDGARSAQL
ncbi:SDR family NAD(P)-dependent oxidoreductase [Vitiosangium sp. GDMCC 1.1324]|uniref:SDR family NAD(P)-dependent oxidoreductase n=1 Tax=Vitiosangium sp. (strain GDMCC 1.1324) TaxID=2138576 RepID=UPI000D3A59DA|nr:SDR family oxidoreductase [Vitiosangium sp. GDMCC 1.1324]PTL85863.1 short-chain dehydrogenase [Vitiosangium sp. GDMCC 1.1324]